jgi:hypothetical protein
LINYDIRIYLSRALLKEPDMRLALCLAAALATPLPSAAETLVVHESNAPDEKAIVATVEPAAILKVPRGFVLIRFFGPRGGGAGW